MLVPLETLSGAPPIPNPPLLASLGLLIGFPLLAAVIIIGISQLSALARRGRGQPAAAGDAVWVGTKPLDPTAGDTHAAISAGEQQPAPTRTGGASARW